MRKTTNKRKRSRVGPRMRISAITVSGFKSICEEQRIELRPLTILAGANSSGKSSMMQPLLLLKQTLDAPFDPGALLLDGGNVRFTATEQLLCKVGGSCSKTFSICLELTTKEKLMLLFKRVPKKGMDIDSMSYLDKGKEIIIKEDMDNERHVLKTAGNRRLHCTSSGSNPTSSLKILSGLSLSSADRLPSNCPVL